MDANAWEYAKNILCVRLDSLGDVLMTTPAIRALKESSPGRRITLLTSVSGARAARFVPEIDEVIIYDAPWLKSTAPRSGSGPDIEMIDAVRDRKFDAAVIFTVYSQNPLPSALFCYLADIPLRLAYCRENPYQLLTSWMREEEPEKKIRHEVRRQLDLAASVGSVTRNQAISFAVPQESEEELSRTLGSLGIEAGEEWILIHPGATAASRRYDPRSFAQAAKLLRNLAGRRIIVSGGSDETELTRGLCALIGEDALAVNGMDLGMFAALVRRSALLISNNTGPVHIAAALGTPVVDLYALTNPQHTPWNVPNRVLSHDVPCRYCYRSECPEGHHDCLRRISPQTVVEAALELLEETGRAKLFPGRSKSAEAESLSAGSQEKEISDVYTGN